jgi:hypothetical protein
MILFEFIREEGGATFMKPFKEGPSYKSLNTSGLQKLYFILKAR